MQSRATTDTACPRYRRVLLKMSGEALEGNAAFGIDHETVNYVASQVKGVREMGVEVAVAIGGGNIWRGEQAASLVASIGLPPTTWVCWLPSSMRSR